jgi:branched-chain amino acid aminotransferase
MPLEQATVGIMTHALHYGTSIFEGIRGNWNEEDEKLYLFRLKEHYERMLAGCKIMRINLPYSVGELCNITTDMVERSGYRQDIYVRPLAYKSEERVATLYLGHLEDGFSVFAIPFGAYLDLEAAARCCTSSWRRAQDGVIPPSIKIGGLYVNSILAKTEAVTNGFDEAILLNDRGQVSEGTGENLFLLKNGKLSTPSIADSVLPGITRDTVIELAQKELGIEVVERSITRSELYLADEIFLTGTAAHLTAVGSVDNIDVGEGTMGPVTRQLQDMYFDVVRGKNSKYMQWCTPATPKLVEA